MGQLSVTDLSTPLVSNAPWIDALISGSVANWNWLVPGRNTVRYTFNPAPDIALSAGVSNSPAATFNSAQQAAARQILAYVTSVTGIQFAEITASDADIQFATCDVNDPSLAGHLTEMIQGLIVLFVGADVLILYVWSARRRLRRTRAAGQPAKAPAA